MAKLKEKNDNMVYLLWETPRDRITTTLLCLTLIIGVGVGIASLIVPGWSHLCLCDRSYLCLCDLNKGAVNQCPQ